MTVKEIFELRKQGRIEEAYDAIRPMYAAHRGRYTTLCMFWTAADVFKLRLDQNRYDEAAKILEALKRILPNVEAVNKELDTQAAAKATSTPAATSDKLPWEHDKPQQEGSSASAFIASATRRLSKVTQKSQKTPKDASPQGDNICDIRAICETEIKVLSDANQSNPSNPCSTADSSDSCSPIPINEQLTANSRQLTSKEEPAVGEDLSGHLTVSLEDGIIRPIPGINAPQRVVLACITAHPGYSVPQISASTGIPAKSIERHVAALIDKNLIEHRGSKKTGGYHAL